MILQILPEEKEIYIFPTPCTAPDVPPPGSSRAGSKYATRYATRKETTATNTSDPSSAALDPGDAASPFTSSSTTTTTTAATLRQGLASQDAPPHPFSDTHNRPSARQQQYPPFTMASLQVLLQKITDLIKTCDTDLVDEDEKRCCYRIDDARRVHDYEPFIRAFLTALAQHGMLHDLVAAALKSSTTTTTSTTVTTTTAAVAQCPLVSPSVVPERRSPRSCNTATAPSIVNGLPAKLSSNLQNLPSAPVYLHGGTFTPEGAIHGGDSTNGRRSSQVGTAISRRSKRNPRNTSTPVRTQNDAHQTLSLPPPHCCSTANDVVHNDSNEPCKLKHTPLAELSSSSSSPHNTDNSLLLLARISPEPVAKSPITRRFTLANSMDKKAANISSPDCSSRVACMELALLPPASDRFPAYAHSPGASSSGGRVAPDYLMDCASVTTTTTTATGLASTSVTTHNTTSYYSSCGGSPSQSPQSSNSSRSTTTTHLRLRGGTRTRPMEDVSISKKSLRPRRSSAGAPKVVDLVVNEAAPPSCGAGVDAKRSSPGERVSLRRRRASTCERDLVVEDCSGAVADGDQRLDLLDVNSSPPPPRFRKRRLC